MNAQDRQDRISIQCWDCGTESRLGDNYCSECGSPVRARLLPAVTSQRSLTVRPSRSLASVVARGITVLVAGKVAEWALRRLMGRAASAAVLPAAPKARQRPLAERQTFAEPLPPLPQGIYSVATLVVQEMHLFQPPAPAPRKHRFFGFNRA